MNAALTIDASKCTGCKVCELACSHGKEGIYSPTLSRIRVVQVQDLGVNVPVVCINCSAAPCIDVCPTSSIARMGDLGVVRIDPERCDGCGLCIEECPYGAVHIPYEKDTAAMCDLCDGSPKCVPECIYGALRYDGRPDKLFASLDLKGLDGTGEARTRAVARAIAKGVRG